MTRAIKSLLACTLGFAMTAAAQVPTAASAVPSPTVKSAKLLPISESDLYCSGFITKEGVSKANYIGGGWSNPNAARFAAGEYIFIAGPALKQGELYSIVREMHDPDRYEFFRGQNKTVNSLGDVYAEVGRARVVGEGPGTTIAQVVFACESAVSGDYVVPFQQRDKIAVRSSMDFDRFAPVNKGLTGRIVLARDFDGYVGNGQKAYLNVGAAQGVKVGDYFRVVRNYTIPAQDPADAISYRATIIDDTQKHMVISNASGSYFDNRPKVDLHKMPTVSLGELVVTNVTPTSATAMVTFSLEELHVGDSVYRDDLPPAPPAPAAMMQPPTISCIAQPVNVRAGNASSIGCDVFSPDNRPVNITFSADRGQLSVNDSTGLLRTSGLDPGPVKVTATAMDDRSLSTATTVVVTVQPSLPTAKPVAAPTPSKLAEIVFKANSTYVDNDAQTSMNEVAQRLQRDTDAHAVIIGMGKLATPAGQRVATRRAENLKAYLVQKGVDASRVQTRTKEDNDRAEIWIVPAGAQMPQ
jgi:hypothetical protein